MGYVSLLGMDDNHRKAITIKLPLAIWRQARAAAAADGTPVWMWVALAIEAKAAKREQ